jgi:hypothetical protein
MTSDRRRAPRVELLGRLHGKIASFEVGITVREMSLGGLSMETPIAFPEGVVHDFRLTLGDESAVVLRGRVVYCRAQPGPDGSPLYVSGVEFVEDEEPGGAVDDLLNRMS